MTDQKVGFAVVGYGFIGQKHAQLVSQNPESELRAIIEADPTHLSKAKQDFPNLACFESLEDFLGAGLSVHFCNICTPNFLHVDQSVKCLKAGYHVICEKPLGLSALDCQALLRAEEETDKKVICVLQNRYSPPIQWLKEVVSSQVLGDVYHLQVNCYWNRDDRYYYPNGVRHSWKGKQSKDGGVLYTQFSHFVDILTWVFGSVKQTAHTSLNFAHVGKTDFEDTGSIIFKFGRGGIGNFNYSTAVWDKNLESTLTIIGQKGSVKIGGQYMDKVEQCHILDYSLPEIAPSQPPNDYGHYKGSAQNHQFVIQNAIDFLKRNTPIDVGLSEGILSVSNIEELSR